MYKFPMTFKAVSRTQPGIESLWTTKIDSNPQELSCAIPPEFNGPGGGFSPEDFYLMALTNCFVATFKVFAQASKLSFEDLSISAELDVDRNEKGQPWMARARFVITLRGASNASLAERVVEKTKNGCLVLNSVNTEKIFETHIS